MATVWIRNPQGNLVKQKEDAPAKLSGVQMTVLTEIERTGVPPKDSTRTINVLHRRGLIADIGPHVFALTDAGKAALAAYVGERPAWVDLQPAPQSAPQSAPQPAKGKEERKAKAAEAAALRAQGFTYSEIATALGLPNCGVAHRLVKQAGVK